MCGYCVEAAMLDYLAQEFCSNTPIKKDQSNAIILNPYAQETAFPMHSLNFARAWEKESDILHVLHCRALGEMITGPDSAEKGSPSHNALVKHYHGYRRMASTLFKPGELENTLPHPSWLILYNPDFVFSKAMWSEFIATPDLLAQCTSLLERYHSWWLQGEGQSKNDLAKQMEDIGVADPIVDISNDEWLIFYNLLPALYFALNYLGIHEKDIDIVKKIALTDPNGVPDFPGLDLWLQRVACKISIQAEGTSFLLDNICLRLRPLLAYYSYLKLDNVKKYINEITKRMNDLTDKKFNNREHATQAADYITKIHSYHKSYVNQ